MTLSTYDIDVAGNDLSNVQEFMFTRGREKVSDQIRAGYGTIYGRRPDLLPAINIGDQVTIRIQPNGGNTFAFQFRCADLRVIYGYTSALDTWELDIEDVFAVFGRGVFGTSWTAGSSTYEAVDAVCTQYGVNLQGTDESKSDVSAQVIINENGLEVLNNLLVTEQGRFGYGVLDFEDIFFFGRGWQQSLTTYDASDDGTGTNPIRYDGLDFAGLADNYADKIVIEPAGLATQSAGIGDYTYTAQSYSQTTGDAANLASFIKGVFDIQDQTPSRLTSITTLNTVAAAENMMRLSSPLSQVKIKHRGAFYYGIVEGFTMRATLDQLEVTYNLSSPGYYPQFILNNAEFGVLDQNKLGY